METEKESSLISLFSKDFRTDDILQRGTDLKFRCKNKKSQCCYVKKDDPCWSAMFGDPNTKVMIIAEAPSATGGLGPHIGGRINDKSNDERIKSLVRFVKKFYKTIPYFTDVVKCGVGRQEKEPKKILIKRKSYCIDRYLLKEINILNPKIILCVGNFAQKTVNNIKPKIENKKVKIVSLLHYGQQANLQISPSEKEKIVWPIQAGFDSQITIKIKDLRFLKKKF
jgi:uracil-DNA glycosylase family 4